MGEDAWTPVTKRDDGKYERTALILAPGDSNGGSVDVVNRDGELIVRLNLFTNEDNSWFACDVIDIAERFTDRRAIVFTDGGGKRQSMNAGTTLVAADFRKKEEE
jgi:hypothetical protein